jgi:replication-associated recombination protein RarA
MFMMKPLAYSLAPSKIEDIVGQEHLVGKNGFIYKMIKNNKMKFKITENGIHVVDVQIETLE